MRIQVFDVEHGGCALVTADSGARILIDSGHNGSTGWRPSNYLAQQGVGHLEKLIITNYDEDHASDLPNLVRTVGIGTLVCNPTVSSADLVHLKDIGGIGNGIRALADLKASYTAPATRDAVVDYGGIKLTHFYNRYPEEFEDENNLSLVVILEYQDLCICFPGDMEVAGWRRLLHKPGFREKMAQVNVLVASHHGRQNGCCEELYTQTGLSPAITIISDSGVQYATQETIAWYRARTRGITLNGENRRVLTTRRDGRIAIEALPGRAAGISVTKIRARALI